MKFGKKTAWMKILAFVLVFVLMVPQSVLAETVADGANVFNPSGFLGDYTVSFYQVDPEGDEIPDNNLIEEYTGVEFGTQFSVQAEKLEKDHPEYKGVEWTVEDAQITNNLAVWAANDENAAQIGNNTYPTLQAAIDAVKDGTAGSGEILLLKSVEENISSAGVNYTLDMQGHTISAPAGSTARVYTINGGTVTMKNGTITGGKTSGTLHGAGLAVLSGAEVKAEGLTITKNEQTSKYGGGMYISGSAVNMQGCSVVENTAASDCGGIYMEDAKLTADRLTVSKNTAAGKGTWGGGICMDESELTLTASSITENSCTSRGGGIYAADSTISLVGVNVAHNVCSNGGGGGIYAKEGSFSASGLVVNGNTAAGSSSDDAGGMTLRTNNITLNDVEISGNKSDRTGGLGVSAGSRPRPASFLADNCRILENEGSTPYFSGAYIRVVSEQNPVAEFRNSTFSGNQSGTTIYVDSGNLKLTNCRIENNTAGTADYGGGTAGAVKAGANELIILENTVITGNAGESSGGVWGNVQMTGGALYGNIATDGSGANDWKVSVNYVNANTSVVEAAGMTDGAQDFSEYVWKDSQHKITLEGTLDEVNLSQDTIAAIPDADYPEVGGAFFFTVGLPSRYVAEITGGSEPYPQYQTVTDAIWNSNAAWDAANTETVKLIAGESDNSGFVITERIYIGDGKIVPIDMNGRTLKSPSQSVIRIAQDGTLILSGAAGGTVSTDSSFAAVVNEGSFTVSSPVVLSGIEHKGNLLALSNGVKVDRIKLAKGKYVTAGEGFDPEELTFELDAAELNALKDWRNAGAQDEVIVTLITPAEGCTLSEELADRITIKGANGFVVVEKDGETGNIIARTLALNGVYVDGVKGDDANPGTHDKPVKTFERAKEALKALVEKQQNEGAAKAPEGIYVLDTVTVSSSAQWTMKDGLQDMKLMREPAFKGALVKVTGSGVRLTLSDITIDGMGDKTSAGSALIEVRGKGELVVADGAVLTNNKCTAGFGGAVYADEAVVTMTGGEISNNSGLYGAGVGLSGSEMTISGGGIKNNTAQEAGGGIGVLKDSKLTLNGGAVSGNAARLGAGISVGGSTTATVGTGKGNLVMNSGEIRDNISRAEGGGIYVQSRNTATITGGVISGNRSSSGVFGGGAIYVNGSRSVDGSDYQYGVLYVTNAVISGNHAGNWGGGIAGCSTSTVNVYRENGAYVYGNTAEDGSNEIFISKNLATFGRPDYFISEYMPDGTPYCWSSPNGMPVASDQLHDTHETIALNNTVSAEDAETSVQITGNSAAIGGGGIGTNGFVQIGTPDGIEIPVTKIWENGSYKGSGPAYVDIWLARNNERVAYLRFKKNSDGTWPDKMTFMNQPLADENGIPYVYTVEEEMPVNEDGDTYPYTSTVTGNADNGFTVTNTYTASGSWLPEGTKVLNGRDMAAGEFRFTVKEGENVVSAGVNKEAAAGVPAEILFDEISYGTEDAGEHTYVIEEVQTGLPAGVTADAGIYTVTVDVKDAGDGTMTAEAQYKRGEDICAAAEFVNKYEKENTRVSFDKIDADTGLPVKGAVLRVVDMDGVEIDEWTTNGRTYTISGILKAGESYRLIEVKAPEGYEIAEDIIFTVDSKSVYEPIVMKDKKMEEYPEHGSVKVTKRLSLNGEPVGAQNQTFYVALYEDQECTRRVTEITPIVFKHTSVSEVTFDGLELGRTYYVGECDVNGEVIYSGTVGDDVVFMPSFANGNAARPEKNKDTAEVEFQNELFTIPTGFYKECELTVTKKLLDSDGDAKKSSDTFYAGIFEDEACTVLTGKADKNIIELAMGGNDEVSQTVALEYLPGHEVTLYVAEVDANGKPVEGTEGFLYSVTYDMQSVTYHDNQLRNAVTITNTETAEQKETEPETEEETQKETKKPEDTKKQAAKTGDHTPIVLYIIMLCAAGAVLLENDRRRRKKKLKD